MLREDRHRLRSRQIMFIFQKQKRLIIQRIDLQKQATTLIEQLPTEKFIEAVDYLAELQEEDVQNVTSDHETLPQNLGVAIHEIFKPFGGVELEISPRKPMRAPPRFDT